ncbi:MAG: CDP-alcohol phosphatidyltransferase family protein [Nocardioides sp.]
MSSSAGEPAPGAPGDRSWTWVIAAVGVHVYTATGFVLGFLMILAAFEGRTADVLWLFLVAMIIDGTDGFLARKVRVNLATPWFDGALLDNIVDYLTYAFAPMIFLWAGGHLPEGEAGVFFACLPLLASSYQFCRSDAKTPDHYFMGFPSYWNILAFYVVVFDVAPAYTSLLLVIFSILVFVPVRYVYPSRTENLWHTNMALTVAWLVAYAVIVAQLPDPNPLVVALSLAYVAFYTAESLVLTLRHHRAASATRRLETV